MNPPSPVRSLLAVLKHGRRHHSFARYSFVSIRRANYQLKEALIKSGFEGDGLQAVRKCHEIVPALAAEGLRCDLIRSSLTTKTCIPRKRVNFRFQEADYETHD